MPAAAVPAAISAVSGFIHHKKFGQIARLNNIFKN